MGKIGTFYRAIGAVGAIIQTHSVAQEKILT